jgi:hypothetical protein
MSEDEAKKFLLSKISVTRQKVTVAKAFVRKHFNSDTTLLIDSFLKHVNCLMPPQILLHESRDPQSSLLQAAESVSWRLAACEAIWGLVHLTMLLPASSDLTGTQLPLGWTTVIPDSGGTTGGWRLDEWELVVPVPRKIARPPSSLFSDAGQPLTDVDLYLHELGQVELDSEVEEALREAVKCFRYELFTACLAMLGKASEGAWIELGLSLVTAFPEGTSFKTEKSKDFFVDPFVGIGKKIREVLKLSEHLELKPVFERANIKLQDLRNEVIWADAVRESRNSIHYGAEPPMSNSYEKVAALLIGAIPHMAIIYTLRAAAKERSY